MRSLQRIPLLLHLFKKPSSMNMTNSTSGRQVAARKRTSIRRAHQKVLEGFGTGLSDKVKEADGGYLRMQENFLGAQ